MKYIAVTGFWSAILSALFGVGYCIAQLLSWLNVLPHPHELFWIFLPSLFLAPAYLVTVLCLHYSAPLSKRIWTAMAVAFGVIYCTFATLNYFTQLTIVVPDLVSGKINESHVLVFKQGSFFYAMDCLGYFFMSFSSLAGALAFREDDRKLYLWMLWNGLLVVIFIPAYFNPFFYYIGSPWLLTFTMAMVSAAKYFKRSEQLIPGQTLQGGVISTTNSRLTH
jgi:hypothetical protein